MIYAYTVRLLMGNATLNFTDYHRNFTVDGQYYIAGNLLMNEGVEQQSEPSADDFTISLNGTDESIVSAFANGEYRNRPCIIKRHEFDENENVISSEDWLTGVMVSYGFVNTDKTSIIKLTVGSAFSTFDAVKKKNLNSLYGDTVNKETTLYWGKETPLGYAPDQPKVAP